MPQPLNTDWKQRLNKKLQNIFINKIVDASYIIEQHIEKELASQKQELISKVEEAVSLAIKHGTLPEPNPCGTTVKVKRHNAVVKEMADILRSKLQELKEST